MAQSVDRLQQLLMQSQQRAERQMQEIQKQMLNQNGETQRQLRLLQAQVQPQMRPHEPLSRSTSPARASTEHGAPASNTPISPLSIGYTETALQLDLSTPQLGLSQPQPDRIRPSNHSISARGPRFDADTVTNKKLRDEVLRISNKRKEERKLHESIEHDLRSQMEKMEKSNNDAKNQIHNLRRNLIASEAHVEKLEAEVAALKHTQSKNVEEIRACLQDDLNSIVSGTPEQTARLEEAYLGATAAVGRGDKRRTGG